MSYGLSVNADYYIKGREAEQLARVIGIPEPTSFLHFDICCSNNLPEHEVDRIVPYGESSYDLVLRRDELHLLQPGDYYWKRAKKARWSEVGSVWDTDRAIALYDRVMAQRTRSRLVPLGIDHAGAFGPAHRDRCTALLGANGCGEPVGYTFTHLPGPLGEPPVPGIELIGTRGVVRVNYNFGVLSVTVVHAFDGS